MGSAGLPCTVELQSSLDSSGPRSASARAVLAPSLPLLPPALSACPHTPHVFGQVSVFHSGHTLVMLFAHCAPPSERSWVWLVKDGCMRPTFSWHAQALHLVPMPTLLRGDSETPVCVGAPCLLISVLAFDCGQNKVPQTRASNQHRHFISQLWRSEVH